MIILLILLLILNWKISFPFINIIARERIFHLKIDFLLNLILELILGILFNRIWFFNRTKNDWLSLFMFKTWLRISKSAIRYVLSIFCILIKNQLWETCYTSSSFRLLIRGIPTIIFSIWKYSSWGIVIVVIRLMPSIFIIILSIIRIRVW
jgi:hypothetical protein